MVCLQVLGRDMSICQKNSSKWVCLIKVRTLVLDFKPLKMGSFLHSVSSLMVAALASSSTKRTLISGFPNKFIFQLTHIAS